MPRSAPAGVLIYAKHLERVSTFYERVLGASVLAADAEHRVLDGADTQLIIHAIPPEYAASIEISTPPAVRDEQAIKPFFTVPDLAEAERVAVECGGLVWGPPWPGPGMVVRNVCDPEGNLVHLRQRTGGQGGA
jgi:predicted enzyme related to lactoylglutathione lyase